MDYQTENPNQDNVNIAQDNNFYSTAANNSKKKSKKKPFIILGIIFLLIIAYFSSAYFMTFWPFSISQESSIELFEHVFEKLRDMENASYEAIFTFKITERGEGMEPLEVDYSDLEDPALERDYQRLSDLLELKYDLKRASIDSGQYPTTLKEANILLKDPLGMDYRYRTTGDGYGYEITIIFESQEAVKAIESRRVSSSYVAPVIVGKEVRFNDKSYQYYHTSFTAEKRKPAFVNLLENQKEHLTSIPGNIEVSANTSGIFYREQEGLSDASFSFGGEMEYEAMTLALGADFMRINDIFYFRLNKIPGIFLAFLGTDISSIKEKWVEIKPEDTFDRNSIFSIFDSLKEIQEQRPKTVKIMEELEIFFEVALEQDLFLGEDNAKKEKLNNKSVFHYELDLNAKAISDFYVALTNELEYKFGDDALIKFSENTLRYLEAPQTTVAINHFNKNGRVDLFLDAKTGYPVKISYEFVLVPGDEMRSLRKKKFIFYAELNLKDINKGVEIKVPEEFMTHNEASMSMSGLSEEEYYFGKQNNNIIAIRRALGTFHALTNTYPDNLSDLELNSEEIKERYGVKDEEDYTFRRYKEMGLIKAIPRDVYSNMSYEYKKFFSDDYKLSYNLKLPKYERGTTLDYDIVRTTTLGASMGRHNYLVFLNGLNTANKLEISEEAKGAQYTDGDNDGLTDTLEDYIGTDKHNKDTDNDEVNDGIELSENSDPLGPGQLKHKALDYGSW
ncbi:MAG: hypothetical protein U9Q96_00475 [Patescibacteria group bacterium]|nr:hypothetical protein [Patescibacteria group bacterium]